TVARDRALHARPEHDGAEARVLGRRPALLQGAAPRLGDDVPLAGAVRPRALRRPDPDRPAAVGAAVQPRLPRRQRSARRSAASAYIAPSRALARTDARARAYREVFTASLEGAMYDGVARSTGTPKIGVRAPRSGRRSAGTPPRARRSGAAPPPPRGRAAPRAAPRRAARARRAAPCRAPSRTAPRPRRAPPTRCRCNRAHRA